MFKKLSRRAIRFSAIACLTLAVVCLWGAESANTAVFSSTQGWVVSGSSSNLSQVCAYNYNTGAWGCFNADYGSYSVSYGLPFGAWDGFFLYDYNQARWVEAIYLFDQRL